MYAYPCLSFVAFLVYHAVCPPFNLSILQPVCHLSLLRTRHSACLSVCHPTDLSVPLPGCPSFLPAICLCTSIPISICLSTVPVILLVCVTPYLSIAVGPEVCHCPSEDPGEPQARYPVTGLVSPGLGSAPVCL